MQARTGKILQSCPSWYPCIRVVEGSATPLHSINSYSDVSSFANSLLTPAQPLAVEFLLDKCFHGNFFLHGILFKQVMGLVGMGINFCNSTKLLMDFELNRDHDNADLPRLASWVVVKAVELLHAQAPPSGPLQHAQTDACPSWWHSCTLPCLTAKHTSMTHPSAS